MNKQDYSVAMDSKGYYIFNGKHQTKLGNDKGIVYYIDYNAATKALRNMASR